jgi:hypothetical protein
MQIASAAGKLPLKAAGKQIQLWIGSEKGFMINVQTDEFTMRWNRMN